jgi:hypothetical protein
MSEPTESIVVDPCEAQALVAELMAHGMTAREIATRLDQRVSYRTIYRWLKGERSPQQASDLDALRVLARGVKDMSN